MKPRNCRGGHLRRPLAILLWNIFTLTSAITSFSYSQDYDVLIVEKPEHLVVYDVYQQSLTSSQAGALRSFEPIKILKSQDVLGDSMTPCAKVQVGGQVFYLLRNARGGLVGSNLSGMVKVFRRVKSIDDTIEVLISRQIAIQSPSSTARHLASAGDMCVRYFEYGGAAYVKRIGSPDEYGWVRLPMHGNGRSWRVARVQSSGPSLSPMIRERVLKRIRQVNLTYLELYSFLSKETNKRAAVPQWVVQSSGSTIICALLPDSVAGSYAQSIRSLAAALQTYLLGTGYHIVEQGNALVIKQE